MSTDKIIVTIVGLAGIVFTYWFFLDKRGKEVVVSSCLEEVVLGDFKVHKYLPLNQKVAVELTPQQTGEFSYAY